MIASFISKNKIALILSTCFLILVWKIISLLLNSELILPSPEETFLSVLLVAGRKGFKETLMATLFRGAMGFSLSFFFGLILGCAAGSARFFFNIFQPLVITIKTVPILAVILLAIIWLNTELVPVFVCFLAVFPVIYSNVTEGIASVDRNLIEMARIYNLSRLETLKSIFIPSILSPLKAGTSIAIGLTWKAVIAAEVLCQPFNALGTRMAEAKINLDTSSLFAWTLIAILLSSISELLLRLGSKFICWKKYGRRN